ERIVGLTPRQTEERLRVARALERLPETSAALAGGRGPFTAVRELTRVLAPETEAEGLAGAGGEGGRGGGEAVARGARRRAGRGRRRGDTESSSKCRPRRSRPTARPRPRCDRTPTPA